MEIAEAQSKILKCLDDYFYSRCKKPTITIEPDEHEYLQIHIKFTHGKYFTKCELKRYFFMPEIEAMNPIWAEDILAMRMDAIIVDLDNFFSATNQLDRFDHQDCN